MTESLEKAIFQIVGNKNTGKTALICRLNRKLREKGLRVGTVKHDAHQFEIDHPGRDTWKHREAGAHAIANTSKDRTGIVSWIALENIESLIFKNMGL